MILLWLAVAVAQQTSEEVIVYGEVRVEQARRKVEQELAEAGYVEKIERDGKTVYRHPRTYMGQMVVDEDGWVVFERQPVQVVAPALPFAEENSAVAWMGCLFWAPACVRAGGQLVGKRKFRGYEHRVVGRVHDDVEDWSDRIADLAIERKLEVLPAQLEALWADGVPLEPDDPPLPTPEARRQALLAFWGSRTDTVWGEQMRDAVEAFCRAVVQRSDHPFTASELAAFNASSTASRAFSLTTPDAAAEP